MKQTQKMTREHIETLKFNAERAMQRCELGPDHRNPENPDELVAYCGKCGWAPSLLKLAEHAADLTLQHASLLRQHETLTQERDALEREVRVFLLFGHGHTGFYLDDGELQCPQCGPKWDYRREPLEALRQHVSQVNYLRAGGDPALIAVLATVAASVPESTP